MASCFPGVLLAASALCCFMLASAADTDTLLDGINKYRTGTADVGALSMNAGASCVAKKLLQQYESKPCSNSTGLDTVPGLETDYPDFPSWLSDCSISMERVKDAVILPDCVPSSINSVSVVSTAVANYTESAKESIENAEYTSAGVAVGNNWFILILATNTSSGDYLQQGGNYASFVHAPSLLSLAFAPSMPVLSIFGYGF